MSKLKITKPDGTTHIVPVESLDRHLHFNSLKKPHEKSTIEEVSDDEKTIEVVHYRNDNLTAKSTLKEKNKELSNKDKEIEKLKKELAAAIEKKEKAK